METQLKIVGISLMILGLIHLGFPKYFKWKIELATLNILNKQIMKIHTLFIGLMVFLMGLLCFTSPTELIHTPLGKKILIGLSIFWLTRLIIQFFGYSSTIWKGKKFETMIHYTFSAFWLYINIIFLGSIFN